MQHIWAVAHCHLLFEGLTVGPACTGTTHHDTALLENRTFPVRHKGAWAIGVVDPFSRGSFSSRCVLHAFLPFSSSAMDCHGLSGLAMTAPASSRGTKRSKRWWCTAMDCFACAIAMIATAFGLAMTGNGAITGRWRNDGSQAIRGA
jgi:hypothetical protein